VAVKLPLILLTLTRREYPPKFVLMSDILSFFISRELFISFAVVGGVCSLIPMVFSKVIDPIWTSRLGKASYIFMFLSMASFIFSGLLA
jgi:hypothetical protein